MSSRKRKAFSFSSEMREWNFFALDALLSRRLFGHLRETSAWRMTRDPRGRMTLVAVAAHALLLLALRFLFSALAAFQ